MSYIERRGIMFVLSSPSGAGKTTVASRLLSMDSDLINSVSVTTRPPRVGETNTQDYHFITRAEYDQMIKNGDFLEHAEVFGHGYGTPKPVVFDALARGKDVIFDIDWQGTQQLAQIARSDLVSVFILPPSYQALEDRLRKRNQDDDDIIERRMKGAENEISHWAEYDYVVVNKDLETTINQVHAILTAERLKRTRLLGLFDFVHTLKPIHQE